MSVTNRPQSSGTSTATTVTAPPSEASAKLAEALDDFLLDVEKKFKSISDEILSKCKLADQVGVGHDVEEMNFGNLGNMLTTAQ